ncbi:MAG TPA: ABC transporter substrate binding protein, partial [Desulfurivibrionaceae bacterium]|nr:ABC transporter substrate binding protein [Desulfurivibrionaceae bacterium]
LFVIALPTTAWSKTVIGVMIPGNAPYFQEIHKAFMATMAAKLPAGRKFEVIIQKPYPDATALSNAARKLLTADPDLIVTYGTSATLAVLNEKNQVPLIYSGVYDPPTAQLESTSATGCGFKIPLTSLLRYLRELKKIETLNVLYCDLENDSVRQVNELAKMASEQQIILNRINLRHHDDLKTAPLNKGDAIFLTGSVVVASMLDEILAAPQSSQQPSAGIFPTPDEAGITISLYHNPIDQGTKTAELAIQVLAGRPAREIQPESLRNTDLTFNLREAKNIGVKIPFQLVAEASKVIK